MLLDSPRSVLPDVRKIAVLRANVLGDYVFTLPALDALRAAYPAAEVVLLGKEWHQSFLRGRPGPVDRVVVVPRSHGVSDGPDLFLEGRSAPVAEDVDEQARFFEAMRLERFDLALQLHGGGRNSNPFLLRLGARFTAGLKTSDAPPLDRWVPYVYFQSEVMRFLEAVALVGARPVRLEPHLAVTEQDLGESLAVEPDSDQPLVALHPGTRDTRKRWPPGKFASVGDALAEAGCRVVVTGTVSERPVVEAVLAGMQADAGNLCGNLSLGGLTGLLSRCAVVVSNDSGPLHVAEAVGAATVGIYWCLNVINAGPLTRFRHRPILAHRLHCPACGANCMYERCEHGDSFVADVTADEVLEAARELLAVRG